MAIIIYSDSTCDLSPELIKENNVKIVPLHVSVPGEGEYLDGVDINSALLYEKVETKGVLPKTGAVNVNEFIDVFTKEINEGNEVFYTGIGSGLSSTYQNAVLAAKEVGEDKIAVVDGQNLSTGTGLVVLRACKFRDQGKSLKEIKEECERVVPLVSAKFCIDRLDYLYKGGRCSGMTKIFAHALKIHPVAKVIDNELKVYKMPRGKYEKAVDVQVDEFMRDLENIDMDHVFITHSGRMDGIEHKLYDKLKEYVPEGHLHITEAGCTICSHCGPKTIGILYILKK